MQYCCCFYPSWHAKRNAPPFNTWLFETACDKKIGSRLIQAADPAGFHTTNDACPTQCGTPNAAEELSAIRITLEHALIDPDDIARVDLGRLIGRRLDLLLAASPAHINHLIVGPIGKPAR